MSVDADKEIQTQPQDETALPNEAPEEDVPRAILAEALRLVTDSQAAVITYPHDFIYPSTKREDVTYEGGSQVQFVVVDSSGDIRRRDQTCIAILNNRTGTPHSFGYALARALAGRKDSTREVHIVRFTQDLKDIALQNATVQILGLSENVKDATGRYSLKVRAPRSVRRLNRENPKNVASRWVEGGAQLMPAEIYTALGDTADFTAGDLKEILGALRKARIDKGMIDRVVRVEDQYRWARRENVTPALATPARAAIPPPIKG